MKALSPLRAKGEERKKVPAAMSLGAVPRVTGGGPPPSFVTAGGHSGGSNGTGTPPTTSNTTATLVHAPTSGAILFPAS